MSKIKKISLCVFCENRANSEEHLWPDWARDSLPEKGAFIAPIIHQALGDTPNDRKPAKLRPAGLRSFRLKVVCETCNNGWMSAIEEDAKPVLLKLISGADCILDEHNLSLISRWMFLKCTVMDHRSEIVRSIPREDAVEFRETGYIPGYFYLQGFFCGEEPWDLLFNQYTTIIPGYRTLHRRLGLQNFRVLAIGFKDLFLVGIINRSPLIKIVGKSAPDTVNMHPHPDNGLSWPLARISAERATNLALFWKNTLEERTTANNFRKQGFDMGIVTLSEVLAEREESLKHGYV